MGETKTITELMLQMKQFEQVGVRWCNTELRWEVTIYPAPINTLGYNCFSESINLRIALLAALKQTEHWVELNAYNIEVDRLQAIEKAKHHEVAAIREAKAEHKIEQFTAFCRFSEQIVGKVAWGA